MPKKYCLADTETAWWAEVDPVTGLCDERKRTPKREQTRLVQIAIQGRNPMILDLFSSDAYRHLEYLKSLANDPELTWVFQNAEYDIPRLAKLGVLISNVDDTMIMSKIISQGELKSHTLEDIMLREVGYSPYEDIDVPEHVLEAAKIPKKKLLQRSDWGADVLTPWQIEYALADVGEAFNLTYLSLLEKIERPWFRKAYDLEMRALPSVWNMKEAGIRVNLPKWKEFIGKEKDQLNFLEDRILLLVDTYLQTVHPEKYLAHLKRIKNGSLAKKQPKSELSPYAPLQDSVLNLVDRDNDYLVNSIVQAEIGGKPTPVFNTGSAQQMRALMNELLDLKPRPDEALYFDGKEVEGLLEIAKDKDHKLAIEILELHAKRQGVAKLVETYGDSYIAFADEEGYIRSDISTLDTDTARFNSQSPNVQNIPRPMQKWAFCCELGEVLLKWDYSAQEIRLFLFLAKQKDWYDRVINGLDFHSMSASFLSGIPYEKLVKRDITLGRDVVLPEYADLRSTAKPVSFAPPYGAGGFRIAATLKIPIEKGKQFVRSYWKTYNKGKEMQDKQVAKMIDFGYIDDLCFGRMRFFDPGVKGREELAAGATREEVYGKYRNKAMNFACQSAGATILRFAMIAVYDYFKTIPHTGAQIRLTIHDSIIATCKAEYAKEVGAKVREIMEAQAKEVVPGISIPVDLDILDKALPSFKEAA